MKSDFLNFDLISVMSLAMAVATSMLLSGDYCGGFVSTGYGAKNGFGIFAFEDTCAVKGFSDGDHDSPAMFSVDRSVSAVDIELG